MGSYRCTQATLAATLCALIALAATVDAATWYVSLGGENNSGCGSQSTPCADVFYTIENVASAGDTILSFPGTFHLSAGDTVTIPYNVTLGPAVPEEGPVVYDYRSLCPTAAATFVVQNSNANVPVAVVFDSATFQNLYCNKEMGESLPAAILLDGSAGGAVEVGLEFVDFMYNTYEVFETDQGAPDASGQVGALLSLRGDVAPASAHLVEPLFSYNQAVGALANGTFAALDVQLGSVYNTSFYAAPAVMVVGSASASIEAVHFQHNQFASPDASFIFVEGSGAHLFVNMTEFEYGSAPAIRYVSVAQTEILGSTFSGMLSPSKGVVSPSDLATCVSIAQDPSVTSQYKIAGCSFASNGDNTSGETAIGAEGFDALTVQQCSFSGNAGSAISLDFTSPRVPLATVFSSLIAVNGSSTGIGVQSSTDGLYSFDLGDSEITGATNAAVQLGSNGATTLSGKVSIDTCVISDNTVGIAVMPSVTVSITGSSVLQNTDADIECDGAVTVQSSNVGTVSCGSSCQISGATCN